MPLPPGVGSVLSSWFFSGVGNCDVAWNILLFPTMVRQPSLGRKWRRFVVGNQPGLASGVQRPAGTQRDKRLLRLAGDGRGARRLGATLFRHSATWSSEWQDNRLR